MAYAVGWRGKWIEPFGIFYWAARPYEPASGRFLAHDSLYDPANPGGFSMAGGDVVNFFDPDGRCLEAIWDKSVQAAAGMVSSGMDSMFAPQEDNRYIAQKNADQQAEWDANYKYYGNSTPLALNATYNPAVNIELSAGQAWVGMGLNYYNSGADLSYSQRVDSVGDAAVGLAQTAGAAYTLYGFGSVAASRVSTVTARVGAWLDSRAPGLNPANYSWDSGSLYTGVPLPEYLPPVAEGGSLLPVKYDPVFALEQGANPAAAVPDIYTVVRGGQTPMPPAGTVFSGSMGGTLSDAAAGVPHGTISATTAGAIRGEGGSVVLAPETTRSGTINWIHVNVTEGGPTVFGPKIPNPVPKPGRIN